MRYKASITQFRSYLRVKYLWIIPALLRRRAAEVGTIALSEIRVGGKARGQGHIQNWSIAVAQ